MTTEEIKLLPIETLLYSFRFCKTTPYIHKTNYSNIFINDKLEQYYDYGSKTIEYIDNLYLNENEVIEHIKEYGKSVIISELSKTYSFDYYQQLIDSYYLDIEDYKEIILDNLSKRNLFESIIKSIELKFDNFYELFLITEEIQDLDIEIKGKFKLLHIHDKENKLILSIAYDLINNNWFIKSRLWAKNEKFKIFRLINTIKDIELEIFQVLTFITFYSI